MLGPLRRWILGHIEMNDSALMIGEDHQNKEHLESHRWYNKEVDGHEIFDMVFQKCSQGRGGWKAQADVVLIHCLLAHLDSKFSVFTNNPGQTPIGIGL